MNNNIKTNTQVLLPAQRDQAQDPATQVNTMPAFQLHSTPQQASTNNAALTLQNLLAGKTQSEATSFKSNILRDLKNALGNVHRQNA